MAPPNDIAVILAKLEELGKKADEAISKADHTNRKIEEMQQSVQVISEEQASLKIWKPEFEGKVSELQGSVFDLKTKVDLFIHNLPKPSKTAEGEVKEEAPTSAHLEVAATAEASGQLGHRSPKFHRSVGTGVVTTLVPPPVRGANLFHRTPSTPHTPLGGMSPSLNLGSAIPALEFPKFDGSNPRIWIRRCETYFDICDTPMVHWVKLATINFTGSATFWMQSVEMNLRELNWNDLCQAVIDRFEKDQHHHLIRQFFHITQSGSVAEYVESFDELVHQLLAHDPYFNPAVITSKFVDGLKSEIKAVVLVHRPRDLDTASSLALLQEEVLLGQPNKDWRKHEEFATGKQVQKNSNTPIASRPSAPTTSEARRTPGGFKNKNSDEKLLALMAYRKAKGLCYKCGMKWGPTHSCPETVPLHMVEELWQLVAEKETSATPVSDSDSDVELMEISAPAAHGTNAGKTIKLQGFIQQHKALLLVDSGSSHCFISEQLAGFLPNWSPLKAPMKVKVADGGVLLCTHELVDCSWLVQGVPFKTTFKILPLKCYDAVLGMTWLEEHSPMNMQWAEKWFSFSLRGQQIKLQGLKVELDSCRVISGDHLYSMQKQDEIWCIVEVYSVEVQIKENKPQVPVLLQKLVEDYSEIFTEPGGTPPARAMTHSIPLLPGTAPFRLRPYRYTPFQKNEIEQQVAKLLKDNMIQESSSPFASPVLLVKKKTGEWRLCVDYRRLNAYTIKNKFPLPIIEELFEELIGARWFTTLDLRSGFHQIAVKLEDQYKTAFQTHFGHFEYKVMPYGLTGAPATFQAIMNHILAPLLRKCVVVFIDDILIYSKTPEEHVQHVQMVFKLLKEHQFKVRLSKCAFAKQQLIYLGHVISEAGVSTDPGKISIVQN